MKVIALLKNGKLHVLCHIGTIRIVQITDIKQWDGLMLDYRKKKHISFPVISQIMSCKIDIL